MRMRTFDFDTVNVASDNLALKEKSKSDVFDIDFNPILMYNVINSKHSLKKLLLSLGIDFMGANIYCPFHPDEMTGKPSAKYHENDDTLYCFSEQKKYTSYHVLKLLYSMDIKKEFLKLWADLSDSERDNFLREFDPEGVDSGKFINPEWKRSVIVRGMFREGKVNFRQHKNALYKISTLIYENNNKRRKLK